MKVGDVGTDLFFTIKDQDGAVVDLSTASSVKIVMSLGGVRTEKTGVIQEPKSGGVVKYTIITGDLSVDGELLMEAVVSFTDKHFTSDRISEAVEKVL